MNQVPTQNLLTYIKSVKINNLKIIQIAKGGLDESSPYTKPINLHKTYKN